MQVNEFKSIVRTFADPGTEILLDKAQVALSVNGDLISASVTQRSGDVYVDEGSGPQPANQWVLTRLAKLPLLAARLRDTVSAADHFVSPAASVLPTLAMKSEEEGVLTDDALAATTSTIEGRSPLETTVLYITSDAGQGKTSLINELARTQAARFTQNESDWLLLPIPLGGRHFLRFDDITVGVLQNKYRFPFLYYNSFLALVRMGVIVPAFDGFEEMFVESSSGEALSAMGILVGSLESQGAIVVAARSAYFEFENLRTQERLFEAIRTYSVGFGKIELKRWDRPQFLRYCANRKLRDGEELYRRVSGRLTADHPLLTRAVLVRRLVDVAQSSPTLDGLLDQIHQSGTDFFSVFVRGIIEREANEKWIDRSGEHEAGAPLLSVDEHCELLAQIALAMWEGRIDSLKRDNLEFVTDYFCETSGKTAFQSRQARERIRGHALLVPSGTGSQAVEFDHDEFRLFFLGEAIAAQMRPLTDRSKADVLGAFRRGVLPRQAQYACIRSLTRGASFDLRQVVGFLQDVAAMDAQASYTQENCSDIIIRILNGLSGEGLEIKGLTFSTGALRERKLSALTFRGCYWSPTSLDRTSLTGCTFVDCTFTQLRVFGSTRLSGTDFRSCTVDSLLLAEQHREIWDPAEIQRQLQQFGATFKEALLPDASLADAGADSDATLRDLQKVVRYFIRSSHMSEGVIRMKLGNRGTEFFDVALPQLLRNGVLSEIENRGGGSQRRFRLGVPLPKLNEAIVKGRGKFPGFLEQFVARD